MVGTPSSSNWVAFLYITRHTYILWISWNMNWRRRDIMLYSWSKNLCWKYIHLLWLFLMLLLGFWTWTWALPLGSFELQPVLGFFVMGPVCNIDETLPRIVSLNCFPVMIALSDSWVCNSGGNSHAGAAVAAGVSSPDSESEAFGKVIFIFFLPSCLPEVPLSLVPLLPSVLQHQYRVATLVVKCMWWCHYLPPTPLLTKKQSLFPQLLLYHKGEKLLQWSHPTVSSLVIHSSGPHPCPN